MNIPFLKERFVLNDSFISFTLANIFRSRYGKLVNVNNSKRAKPNVNNNIVIPDIKDDDFIIVDNIIIITEINIRDCE